MHHAKWIGGSLLAVIAAALLAPTPAYAANEQCIRLKTNDSALYYDYNPATSALKTLTLNFGETVNWSSRSPDGTGLILSLGTEEKGKEIVRFIDFRTQKTTDVSMDNMSSAVTITGVSVTGWSPDSQFFALPTTSYDANLKGSMKVFARDGSLAGEVPFDNTGGTSTWAWTANSDQIALSQANPDSAQDSSLITFFSLPNTAINTVLEHPISELSALIWSPDGRFVAVTNWTNAYVIDSTTGTTSTAAQNVFVSDPYLDLVWSSDGKALLSITYGDQSDLNPYDIVHYTVSDQTSQVVMEGAGAIFSANPYAMYGGVSANGVLLVNQVNNGSITYFLIDARTGTSRQLYQVADQDTNYNAGYIWSPSMTSLWLTTDPAIVVRPENMTQFKLPAGIYVDGASLAGSWSQNGDWTVVGSMQEGMPYTIWAINTRTGASRQTTVENPPYTISLSNSGGLALYDSYSYILSVNSANGGNTVITEALATLSTGGASTQWSPDGSRLAFLETPSEGDGSILKVVQSNGALISSIDIPVGSYSVESLEWVSCI